MNEGNRGGGKSPIRGFWVWGVSSSCYFYSCGAGRQAVEDAVFADVWVIQCAEKPGDVRGHGT